MSGKPNTEWKKTMLKRFNGDQEALTAHMGSIGSRGGSRSTPTGGFGNAKANPSESGRKGGYRSKRGHTFIRESETFLYYTNKKTGELVSFRKHPVI